MPGLSPLWRKYGLEESSVRLMGGITNEEEEAIKIQKKNKISSDTI